MQEANSALFNGTHLVAPLPGESGMPAKLHGFNIPFMFGMLGLGSAAGFYGKFVRGYNKLWLVGGLVPFLMSVVYNEAR